MILAAAILGVTACPACPTPADPARSQNRVELAKGLIQEKNLAAAESEIKRAQALNPRNEEAFYVHGFIHTSWAHEKVTIAEYQNCLDGTEAVTLRDATNEHMRQAETKFRRAVELAPDYGDAWDGLGVVAMHFGDPDAAIEHEQRALGGLHRLRSEALARANFGWAYYKKRAYAQATTELLQAINRDPGLCLAWYRLAQVYFDENKQDEAAERIQIFGVSEKCGRYATVDALYLGGQISLRQGDADTARAYFERCHDLSPKSCRAAECDKALANMNP
jgi:Tfp pilus assembly protein PilF